MTNSIVALEDFQRIVDQWLKAESEGEKFPVDFDVAWQLAGYATKASAKRAIDRYMEKGVDYLFNNMLKSTGGRGSEVITLTCDALKELCMLSRSVIGKNTRKYFIDAEKKWKMVEKHFPEVASEIQLMQLKKDIVTLEAQRESAIAEAKKADLALMQFRNTIIHTCPEPIQQKILGFSVVEKIEYRDRVIKNEQLINDGSTISKTDLCYRYNFMTRGGKPDYKRLNLFLDLTGTSRMTEAWNSAKVIQENMQFKREYLPMLDDLMLTSDRQLHIGE